MKTNSDEDSVRLLQCPHCLYWANRALVNEHLQRFHYGKTLVVDSGRRSKVRSEYALHETESLVERPIFRAWKRDAAGRRLWAKDFGLRAWKIYVPSAR